MAMLVALLAAVSLRAAAGHGWVYDPISMQDLTYRLRSYSDWQDGMPASHRYEPWGARLAPGRSPEMPGESCGAGSDPLYAEGLQTWQKWYQGARIPVPRLTPGAELEVRAQLTADHGGQAWMQIACSDRIGENVDWILLERAPSDRGHHFMPSNPSIYAWAFGDVATLDGREGVITARWLVPETFSCPTGRVVGRWIWKVANTCLDADNLGVSTESFSLEEYRDVVDTFNSGQNVQGRCTSESPEHFLSCFVFSTGAGSNPSTAPATTTVPAPVPTSFPTSMPTAAPSTLAPVSTTKAEVSTSAAAQTCIAASGNGVGVTDASCAPCAFGQQYWPCDSPSVEWNLCLCTSTPASLTTQAPASTSASLLTTPAPTSTTVPNAPSVSTPGQRCTAVSNNIYGLTDESCMPCATGQQYYPCDSAVYTWNLCICSASLAQHSDRAFAAVSTAIRRQRLRSQHHVLTAGNAFVQTLNRLAKAQDLLEERKEEFYDALQCDSQKGMALKALVPLELKTLP